MIYSVAQAQHYLEKFIPKDVEFKFPGELGLLRTAYLLELLGSPHNTLRVIHIAGTSGKGSTSYLISIMLKSLGFKVGLCVSPILLDTRERFQINNSLISEVEYCAYLSDILPSIEKVIASKFGPPTHYEILVALTYYIFAKQGVDYAVVETGLGGLLDGTNVVTREDKVAVITRIGHDHTAILGKTLSAIAGQKAGIIQPRNTVLMFGQHRNVMRVITDSADHKKARLYVVDKSCIRAATLTPNPTFDFSFNGLHLKQVSLHMLGSFQIENCSLALAVLITLSKRDSFVLDERNIKKALMSASFSGRMEKFVIENQTVIVDGAHNPQKLKALLNNLLIYYPNQKFSFMISLRRGKNYLRMLCSIIPFATSIILTPFESQTKAQGFSALAEDTAKIVEIFTALKFSKYVLCESSQEALQTLLKQTHGVKVITGSLYLLSELYPTLTAMSRHAYMVK